MSTLQPLEVPVTSKKTDRTPPWKVLLVDDEAHIREGLRDFIDWESLDLRVVGEAESADEALQKTFRLQPDIVLSDIVMPDHDGIWFAGELRKTDARIHLIFISAYERTDYFRAALQLAATDYLLKPINEEELMGVLQSAVHRLETAAREEKKQSRIRRLAQRNASLLVDSFFRDAIFGGFLSTEELERAARRAGVALDRWKDSRVIAVDIRTGNPEKLTTTINRLEWSMPSEGVIAVSSIQGIGVLVANPHQHIDGVVRTIVNQLTELGYEACVSIGEYCPDLLEAPRSLALALRRGRDYIGPDRVAIVGLADTEVTSPRFSGTLLRKMESLSKSARNGSPEDARNSIDQIFSYLASSGESFRDVVNGIAVDVLIRMSAGSPGASSDANESIIDEVLERVVAAETFDTKRSLMRDCVDRLIRPNNDATSLGTRRVVQEVVDLIETNYMDESLSIVSLADAVSLSPNYLGTLFKEETGRTIHQHILAIRLSRAKQMIADPRYRTYEIANAVGYGNANYFSKLFKKETGMTPRKYRESIG